MKKPVESQAVFKIGHSKWLRNSLYGIHFLAAIACWQAQLTGETRAMLLILVLISLIFQRNRYTKSLCFLYFRDDKGWFFSSDGKHSKPVLIKMITRFSPFFVVVTLQLEHEIKRLIICGDSMKQDMFRRLNVLLKVTH
ncbi:protein YgfX [methane-oxidizing endosymbiont of Gigantopelta aegis]|uniref:protein YgfX n=1 Tax=methane-oxidizing endosymbiont of Gigantopelta aegis TaxID=2794938 RepID=UPI0018DE0151|nr:protein YgfX [methane-oxidizing endosymbiont of Gigantopelta aegis]